MNYHNKTPATVVYTVLALLIAPTIHASEPFSQLNIQWEFGNANQPTNKAISLQSGHLGNTGMMDHRYPVVELAQISLSPTQESWSVSILGTTVASNQIPGLNADSAEKKSGNPVATTLLVIGAIYVGGYLLVEKALKDNGKELLQQPDNN